MRSFPIRTALLGATLLALASCSDPVGSTVTGPQPQLNSTEVLYLRLAFHEKGYALQFRETVDDPILPALTDVYTYSGDELRLYGFDTQAAADSAVLTISQDGETVAGEPVPWIDGKELHYFQMDKLLILHRGDRSDVDQIITELTGGQFAGN